MPDVLNKDIVLKDLDGTQLWPLAHRDSGGYVIEETYLKNYIVKDGVRYNIDPSSLMYVSSDGSGGQVIKTITGGDVAIVESIQYGISDSATEEPSSWYTELPTEIDPGKYLWTKTIYANGAVSYSISYQGTNGESPYVRYIESTTDSIIMDRSTHVMTPPTVTFNFKMVSGQNEPSPFSGYYTIQSTQDGTTYTGSVHGTGTTTGAYTPDSADRFVKCTLYNDDVSLDILDVQTVSIISDGLNGAAGITIDHIEEYYMLTQQPEPAPTPESSEWVIGGGSQGLPTMTQTDKYLWNYEKVYYSNNTTYVSDPVIIGAYGDNGRGITSITEYYLVNNSTNTPVYPSSEWGPIPGQVSENNRYLWNYEHIIYSDNTDYKSVPAIIGMFSKDGTNGTDSYTVLLSNENHTFPADSTGHATGSSTTGNVIGYIGTNRVATYVDTANITGTPTGLTFVVSDNGTDHATYTVTAGTTMTSTSGTLTIPIILDHNTSAEVEFLLDFSYSLAVAGVDGDAAIVYSLQLSSATINLDQNNNKVPNTLTLNSFKQIGTGDPVAYQGRFYVEQTTDFSNWTMFYNSPTSGSVKTDESTATINLNPLPSTVAALRCRLHKSQSDFSDTPLDSQTILFVHEGRDAYTIRFREDNVSFAGVANSNGTGGHATSSETKTVVLDAFRGTTRVRATIHNTTPNVITGIPSGMSVTPINPDNPVTNPPSVTLSPSSSMTSQAGTISFPVEVDDIIWRIPISYNLVWSGVSPTSYSVVPSYNYILIDKYDQILPSNQVVFGAYATVGNNKVAYSCKFKIYTMSEETSSTPTWTMVYEGSSNEISHTYTITNKNITGIKCEIYNGTTKLDEESIPVITQAKDGQDGAPGSPGRGISGVTEYYYATEDNSLPSGITWETSIAATGFGETYKYLWNYESVAYTTGPSPVNTNPAIIAVWSKDGKGIEEIEEYYTTSNSTSIDSSEADWSKVPPNDMPQVDENSKYLWNYEKIIYTDGTYLETTPAIVGNYAADGQNGNDGSNGFSSATIYLYRRASEAPELPQGDCTYNFAEDSLDGDIGEWSRDFPDQNSANDPVWLTLARAVSDDGEDTIGPDEWQSPILLVENGSSGIDGYNTATIYLYQRSVQPPSVPNTPVYYKFSDKTLSTSTSPWSPISTLGSWSTTIPNSGTNPIWITAASVSSRNDISDSITNWVTPAKMAQNGIDGISVDSITEWYLTTNSTTTPAYPSSQWVNDPTDAIMTENSQYLWNYEDVVGDNGQIINTTEPTIIGRYGQNGAPGVGISGIKEYYKVTQTDSVPNNDDLLSWVEVPGTGRTANPVPKTDAEHRYLWNCEVIDWTEGPDTKTSPALVGVYGDSALAYELTTSNAAIIRDGNTGVLSPSSITIYSKSRSGQASAVNYDGKVKVIAKKSDGTDIKTTNLSVSSGSCTYRLSTLTSSQQSNLSSLLICLYADTNYTTILDQQSVPVIKSGEKGDDAAPVYTVWLSNENHTFPADKDGNPISGSNSTTSTIYVYKDGVRVSASNISITSGTGTSGGLTITRTSGTNNLNISVDSNASLNGSRTITIRTDSIDFPVTFSYSLAVAGQTGAHGVNSATVEVFKTSSGTPSGISSNTTYYFEDYGDYQAGTLVGDLNDWSQSQPTTPPVWKMSAVALSSDVSDTILSTDWTAPIKISGKDGTNGYNYATIYLYKRGSSATKPESNSWYKFSTDILSYTDGGTALDNLNGWTRTIPDQNSANEPLWVTIANISGQNDSIQILANKWARAVIMAENGQDGNDGISITGVEEYYISTQNNVAPTTLPTHSNHNGWEITPSSVTFNETYKYLWNSEIVRYSNNTYATATSPALVSIWTKDGRGIVSIVDYYLVSDQDTGITRNSSEWSTTPDLTTQEKPYLWNYERITWTAGSPAYTDTDPIIIGVHGNGGEVYTLQVSDSAIVRDMTTTANNSSRTLSPTSLTLSAYSKIGNASQSPYTGRFRLEKKGSGSWTTVTTSSDTSSYTYNSINTDDVRFSPSSTTINTLTTTTQGTNINVTLGTSPASISLRPGQYRLTSNISINTSSASTVANARIAVYVGSTLTYQGNQISSTSASGTSSIVFTLDTQTTVTFRLYYTLSGAGSISITSPTLLDSTTQLRASLYKRGGTSVLLDQQTIPIINAGTDSYTAYLTNDNHSFPADRNGNPISSIGTTTGLNITTTTAKVYRGSTSVSISNISWPTTTGLTISRSGATVTFTAVSGIARSGKVTLTITADGRTFPIDFSYSLAVAGQIGRHGFNSCPVRLYQTSDNAPDTYPDTATYTFSDDSLIPTDSGSLHGWSQIRPTAVPIWEITATALSQEDTDIISGGNSSEENEWSEPLLISGKNGLDGYNQATLYLYCRSSGTVTKPADGALDYNFSNGKIYLYNTTTEVTNTSGYNDGYNEWTRAQPTGSNPLYVTSVSLIRQANTTNTISINGWSDASKVSENGIAAGISNNGGETIKVNEDGVLSSNHIAEVSVWGLIGSTDQTISSVTLTYKDTTGTYSMNSTRTTTKPGFTYNSSSKKITITFKSGWPASNESTSLDTVMSGTINITFTVGSKSFTFQFNFILDYKTKFPTKITPLYYLKQSELDASGNQVPPSRPILSNIVDTDSVGVWTTVKPTYRDPEVYIDQDNGNAYVVDNTVYYYWTCQLNLFNNGSADITDVVLDKELNDINVKIVLHDSEIINNKSQISSKLTAQEYYYDLFGSIDRPNEPLEKSVLTQVSEVSQTANAVSSFVGGILPSGKTFESTTFKQTLEDFTFDLVSPAFVSNEYLESAPTSDEVKTIAGSIKFDQVTSGGTAYTRITLGNDSSPIKGIFTNESLEFRSSLLDATDTSSPNATYGAKVAWVDSNDGGSLGASALSLGDPTTIGNRWRVFTMDGGKHLAFTRHQ